MEGKNVNEITEARLSILSQKGKIAIKSQEGKISIIA